MANGREEVVLVVGIILSKRLSNNRQDDKKPNPSEQPKPNNLQDDKKPNSSQQPKPNNLQDGKKPDSSQQPKPGISDADADADDDNVTDIASLYSLNAELSQYLDTIEHHEHHNAYHVYPGVEMSNYDFTVERVHIYSTNFIESTSHLIKSCLGTGVLSIHEGYKIGGLWASLGGTIFNGIICYYVMYILVNSAQKMYGRLRVPRLSYPDLAEAALATGPIKCMRRYSKVFRYFVDICLIVEMSGTSCVYVIMIADTLKQVLEGTSDAVKEWDMSTRIYILIIVPPIILLSIIRNLKYLAPFSLIADIIVGMCVLMTIYYGLSAAKNVSIEDRPAWKSFPGFIHFLGISLYGTNGICMTLPIENNMRKPQDFPFVLKWAMTTVVICMAVMGFSGYLGWGEECSSPITVHMPVNVKRGIWERVYRIIHVILIVLLSLALPNMIDIVIFIGNFVLAFIAMIIPAFIDTLVIWQEHGGFIRRRLLLNIMVMFIGGILCSAWFYSSSE